MFFFIIYAIIVLSFTFTLMIWWDILHMDTISHREKRKRYHDSHCRKELLHRAKYNRRKNSYPPDKALYTPAPIQNTYHKLKAPKVLNIFDDTHATLEYFSKVINTISQCRYKDSIYFDLSDIESITPDAIMYLIAIIKNLRRVRGLEITCLGNTPKVESAKEMIEQSGFFTFVSSFSQRNIQTDNRYMKISAGKDANPMLASSFCDFVQTSCNQTHLNTKRLYPMIIELMTNTHQHAYGVCDEKQIMMENWYIFAQDTGHEVHFVFLDTGVGIPKTVAKKFSEKIRELLLVQDDAAYLQSALKGEFRSETKQEHRGKGLPGIYEDALNSSISDLSIISGKGKCTLNSKLEINAERLSIPFEGTLFTWNICKKEEQA